MAIHKIIELSCESNNGWEDAARKTVAEAARTVDNIKSVYVRDFVADVRDNRIVNYRVHAKVTFEVTQD